MWLGNTYLEKRTLVIAVAVLLIFAGGVAAFVLRPWDTEPDTTTTALNQPEQAPIPSDRPPIQTVTLPPDRPAGHGNTPGNILAMGVVVYSDGWIYRVEGLSTLVKTRIDGTGYQILDIGEVVGVENLNTADGWIYHTQTYFTGGIHDMVRHANIYRIRTDGTDLERISDDAGLFLNVADGWIYYVNRDSNRNLYRIRTDGTGRERLSDHVVNMLHVMDGWVFYNLIPQNSASTLISVTFDDDAEFTERGYIYKVRVDGTERTRISDANSQAVLSYDGWIYYTDRDNGLALYRVRTDGTEVMRIVSDRVHLKNIVDGWIYYVIFTEEPEYRNLYKVRPDGTDRQLVYDGMIEHFSIAGGWIFYARVTGFSPRFKLSLDGTTQVELSDLRQ